MYVDGIRSEESTDRRGGVCGQSRGVGECQAATGEHGADQVERFDHISESGVFFLTVFHIMAEMQPLLPIPDSEYKVVRKIFSD